MSSRTQGESLCAGASARLPSAAQSSARTNPDHRRFGLLAYTTTHALCRVHPGLRTPRLLRRADHGTRCAGRPAHSAPRENDTFMSDIMALPCAGIDYPWSAAKLGSVSCGSQARWFPAAVVAAAIV